MMFELVEPTERLAQIKVIGVGGAGGNAVNRMIESGLTGVDFLALNTDLQALRLSKAQNVLQIGSQSTRGLGSGGNPETGRRAMLEDEAALRDAIGDSDMVFVTAGMGGGTGTGAAPIVAAIARDAGALTVGVVTKPFRFEGKVRMQQAEDGLSELRDAVDTLIVIPNERLLEVAPEGFSMVDAFVYADNVLYEATRGIHDIIMKPHQVNLDFADVRSVMEGMGVALMGAGKAVGPNRAQEAARQAISSPLLENIDISGAQGVLVNLTGSDIGLQETNTVMSLVQDAAGDQAHIIFGYGLDPELGEELQVTVIATGFDGRPRSETTPTLSVPAAGELLEMSASAGSESPSVEIIDIQAVGEPFAELEPEPELEPIQFAQEPAPAALIEETPVLQPSETAMRFTMVEAQPAAELMPGPAEDFAVEAAPAVATPEAGIQPAPEEGLHVLNPNASVGRGDDAQRRRRDGFLSDALMKDLSEPAYTRKYMD